MRCVAALAFLLWPEGGTTSAHNCLEIMKKITRAHDPKLGVLLSYDEKSDANA